MAYTYKQKRVAKHIYDVGRKKGASRKELLAALETGLVEANLGNPKGGSGTSAGWRQEISSYGSVGKRTNVRGAARRYFNETAQAGRGKGMSAGQLAQAVQRSAYPGRYDERRGQAKDLLHYLDKTYTGSAGKGSRGRTVGGNLQGKLKTTPGLSRAPERLQAKRDVLLQSHGGMPSQNQLLSLASTLGDLQDTPPSQSLKLSRTKVRHVGGGGKAATGSTTVRLAAGADRPGVKTSHYLRRVLSGVQGIPGGITITTGSNHNQMTVNGNQSDHWTGHAGDIAVPVDSKRGDLIAGRVLMRLGVPRAKARQMARQGGLFNVQHGGKRWQVIWKTNEGGNHHNHVHVGVK